MTLRPSAPGQNGTPEAPVFLEERTFLQRCLYDISHAATRAILTTMSSMRVQGQNNVPATGRALIIGPHTSEIDPFVIGSAIKRRIYFLGKKQIRDNRLTRPFFDAIGMIPVDRDHPGEAAKALNTVRRLLEQDEAVLLFPEGERTHNSDGSMQNFKDGVSLLAKRTKSPVVPVGVSGTFEALPRSRKIPHFSPVVLPASDAAIAVSIGEVIDPEEFIELNRSAITKKLFDAVKSEKERSAMMHKRRPF